MKAHVICRSLRKAVDIMAETQLKAMNGLI